MVRQAFTGFTFYVLTLLALVAPAHAALILNEALANEPGSTTSLEWVEILHWPDSGAAISLAGHKYIDGGVITTIDTALDVLAGGFAILARKATGPSSFEERWGNASGVWGDHESESYPLISISQISLRNSSDTLRLISPSGDTSTIFWTSDTGDGVSIERVRPGANDALSNFAACEDSLGSTPGSQNSVLPARGDLTIDTVVVGPAVPVASEPIQFAVNIRNVGFGDVEQGGVALSRIPHPSSTSNYVQQIMASQFGTVGEGFEVSKVLEWPNPRPGISYMRLSLFGDGDTTNDHYNLPITVRFDQPYLIISEYLANPEVGGPEEWVEIANTSGHSVNFEGVRIGDSLNQETLPYSEIEISAYKFAVLVESESAFRAHYPEFDGALIEVSGWRALNNTGDGIRLIGPSGEIIDSLTFRTTYLDNRSIERVELSPAFAAPDDWAPSEADIGSTPGLPNSVQRGNPGSLVFDSVWLAPSNPQWGDSIRVFAAVNNNSFGPAEGWSVVVSRDLDFSSPGASLEMIGQAVIPTTEEDESQIVGLVWVGSSPGVHRFHIALRDETNDEVSSSALVSTIRFSPAMIIVSEYMAAPTTGGPGEWIELYNPSEIPVSFMGVRIGNEVSQGAAPPPTPILAQGQFLVLVQDEDRFRSFYPQFSGQLRSLSTWPSLSDEGDILRIQGPAEELIDSTSFFGLSTQNRSRERRVLTAAMVDQADWGLSIDSHGATPGRANSIARFTNDLAISRVDLSKTLFMWHEPVTGGVRIDNAGFASVPGKSIRVFEAYTGQEIGSLATPEGLAPGGSVVTYFSFDGITPGQYELWFELPSDDNPTNNHGSLRCNVAHEGPALIVSEYMASPETDGPGEWVELYNATEFPLTLRYLRLGDAGGTSYLNSNSHPTLAPGEYIVVCANPTTFSLWYPDFDGPLIQPVQWLELNNDGDKIRLLGTVQEVIDTFTYAQVSRGNVSRERLNTTAAYSHTNDWTASVDPSGATPGRPNSVNAASAGPLRVEVSPNPVFRSAGQTARIDYQLEIGESLTLRIYDRAGRIVRTIADETPSATGFVEWNGTDDDGHELMPGPYILLARSEPAGSIKKLVVVIAP